MSAVLEIDRHDGLIAVTSENTAELVAEVRRLREEAARLRVALRQILEIQWQEYGPDYEEIEIAQNIAADALGLPPPPVD